MTMVKALTTRLTDSGVAGITIAWADNSGIPRSRTVPVAALPRVAATGVGVTSLFAVFDSSDGITFAHEGLATPSGDVRLVPVLERLTPLAGQPALAWAPGRQVAADGDPWPYGQRCALERQVEALAADGLTALIGYELEFGVYRADDPGLVAAHPGPAYSPHALVPIDGFVADVLRDCAANGIELHQLHAEYGPAQMELSLAADRPGHRGRPAAAGPPDAARRGRPARAAALASRRCRPRPLRATAGTCTARCGGASRTVIAGPDGTRRTWRGCCATCPALAAITAPSIGSLARLRPGYFAGAFAFWGIENREAPLRYVPGGRLVGDGAANVELKASDASANPYLALAALLACGAAGVAEGLTPPEPIAADPGTWSAEQRAEAGVAALPSTPEAQEEALLGCPRIAAVLGEELLGAFLAVRRSDAAAARERELEDVLTGMRWRY